MPSTVLQRSIRTVKQCPPFVDVMAHGFLIPLPCDVHVDKGRFRWDWDLPPLRALNHPRSPLSFHVAGQLVGSPLARGDQVAIKFNSFWTVALEPGWSLMATHPINREDLPFRLVTGLVDADRIVDAGINFPAIWTDPGFAGTLERGTPIAQCFAVPRSRIELVFEAMSVEHTRSFDALSAAVMRQPGVNRKQHRSKRDRS